MSPSLKWLIAALTAVFVFSFAMGLQGCAVRIPIARGYDPVGNIQMVRPRSSSDAGYCLADQGWPLMDKDTGVFVACLKGAVQ